MPALAPGLYVGLHILSIGQVPAPGIDLGFLGAPGCAALVAGIDLGQSMVGGSSSQTTTLTIPAGIPSGAQIFSQSIALFPPNSLPNGQNAFGAVTSNGVKSFVNAY